MKTKFLRVAVTVMAPEGHFPRNQRVFGLVQHEDSAQGTMRAKQESVDYVAEKFAKENPGVEFKYAIATATSDFQFVLMQVDKQSSEDLDPWNELARAEVILSKALEFYVSEGGDINDAIDSIRGVLEDTAQRLLGAELDLAAKDFKIDDAIDEPRTEIAQGEELKGESDEQVADVAQVTEVGGSQESE